MQIYRNCQRRCSYDSMPDRHHYYPKTTCMLIRTGPILYEPCIKELLTLLVRLLCLCYWITVHKRFVNFYSFLSLVYFFMAYSVLLIAVCGLSCTRVAIANFVLRNFDDDNDGENIIHPVSIYRLRHLKEHFELCHCWLVARDSAWKILATCMQVIDDVCWGSHHEDATSSPDQFFNVDRFIDTSWT